jgi:hypothetical protein
MAIFPQGLTNIDQRCNAGERRMLHQLKRCLGDDHLVWHNVPIGPRAREPDFVVLSPAARGAAAGGEGLEEIHPGRRHAG